MSSHNRHKLLWRLPNGSGKPISRRSRGRLDRSGTLCSYRTVTRERRALLLDAKISPTPFREALSSGEPVRRPAPIEGQQQIEHEAWVMAVLAGELHMTAEQIKELDVEQAKQLVIEHWSRPTAP